MPAPSIPSRALLPFFLIAFGLAWGLFVLFLGFPEAITRMFGPLSAANPLFILAVYAPAIAALTVILVYGGRRSVLRFLKRLFLWRLSLAWVAFLVLAIPAIAIAGAVLKGGPFGLVIPQEGMGALVGALLFMLVLGPVEEFGWRGVALPLLQRRMTPLAAGLLLGFAWAIWHLPAFFADGTPQSAWGILPFLLGATAASVIMVPMFNASGGSLLWAALFHFQLNNPMWPDGQPWDMYLYVAVAIVVVALNWQAMTRRGGAATQVLQPPSPSAPLDL